MQGITGGPTAFGVYPVGVRHGRCSDTSSYHSGTEVQWEPMPLAPCHDELRRKPLDVFPVAVAPHLSCWGEGVTGRVLRPPDPACTFT